MLKKKNNQNILIIGSGRWAIEIIKEILNIKSNSNKLFILGNNKRIANIATKFKINKIKSLNNIYNQFFSHIIICNKTTDHFKYFNIVKNLDAKILIEKPLTANDNKNFEILKFSQNYNNKIFLSSQFFFSEFFYLVKKELNKNKFEIKSFKLIWHDKKDEFIKGVKKKQNFKVKYIIDVFYHFFSIFNLFINSRKINIFRIKKKNNCYLFKLNDIDVILDINRNKIKKCRKILLNYRKNNQTIIDFKNYSSFKNKNNSFRLNKKDKCLSKQLDFFLNSKKVIKSHYSLVENNKDLFLILKKINLIK